MKAKEYQCPHCKNSYFSWAAMMWHIFFRHQPPTPKGK